MPYCTNCGAQYDDGAKFCPTCGATTGEAAQSNAQQNAAYTTPLSLFSSRCRPTTAKQWPYLPLCSPFCSSCP